MKEISMDLPRENPVSSSRAEQWDLIEKNENEKNTGMLKELGKLALIIQKQKERDELLTDMLEARKYFDGREAERNQNRHNERAQELFEKELNNTLTTTEQLFDAIDSGEEGISLQLKNYDDSQIPVISLEGFPYAMLTHTVDYRGKNVEGNNASGRETTQLVLDDPSVWAENLETSKESFTHGGMGRKNAKGNVICASYTNSEHNMKTSYLFAPTEPELTYGFNQVLADSVLRVANGDAMTPNLIGENPTELYETGYLDELESTPSRTYNEVDLRRYDKSGKPKLPDYIVVKDGKITETVLKHAKYFNVPIIDIKTPVYESQQKQTAQRIIDSISNDEPYPELRNKIDKLYSLDSIGINPEHKKSIGCHPILSSFSNYPNDSFSGSLNTLEIIDAMRGLSFVKEELKKQIHLLQTHPEKERPTRIVPEIFDSFDIVSTDVHSLKETKLNMMFNHEAHAEKIINNFTPEARNSIHIRFKLRGSHRETDFLIEDGEHPIGGSQYIQPTADSRYYDDLAPVVNEYLALLSQPAQE